MSKMGNFMGGGTPPILPTGGNAGGMPGLSGIFQRGQGGILPERGSAAQLQAVMQALQGAGTAAQDSGSPLLAFLTPMIGGAVGNRTQGLYKDAQKGRDSEAIDALLGSMGGGNFNRAPVLSTSGGGYEIGKGAGGDDNARPNLSLPGVPKSGTDMASLITETAEALQMDPLTLGTIISYETAGTFDPVKAGPVTQHGQHRGVIQFGEPQAKQYGADFSSPEAALRSQLGADGAVARYFMDRGWKPGMSDIDAYSIVNAGAPGRHNASDANNGGAPGTVADKVNTQMDGHRQKAAALLGREYTPTYSTSGGAVGSGPQLSRDILELMVNPDVSEPLRDLAGTLAGQGIKAGQGMTPLQQLQYQKAQLQLDQMMNPTMTPQEQIALQKAQIELDQLMTPKPKDRPIVTGADGYQYYQDDQTRVLPNVVKEERKQGTGELAKQYNQAATIIQDAIKFERDVNGLTDEEARAKVMSDPLYARQLELLQIADQKLKDEGATQTASAPPPPPGTVPY